MTPAEKAAALLSELERRRSSFRIEAMCFPEQVAFIRDKSRFKAACCSRRAGKSIACAADMIETALSREGAAQLYLAPTLKQAKRIIWRPLKDILSEFGIPCKINESEYTVTFENNAIIYLSGAKDATEVAKYLGYPLIKVYIDEAQSFRAYIQELVDDVLSPTMYDYAGTICLIGTPGPVPVGYFYDLSTKKGWSHHHWTMFQNPHLRAKSGKDPMDLVLEDCERMGLTLDSPRIQRNAYGRWVVDSNSLVFRWAEQNHFEALPDGKRWEYVIGVDLGWSDADAVAVLGWCEKGPEVYLVHEWVKAKSGITELAEELQRLVTKYNPHAIVMDTAALGVKIAEECRRRFALPVKATKKTEKFAHIELVNDALRTRRLMAKRTSVFAHDCHLVEWDRDKSNGDRLVIAETFHSDICDAVLYAFREAQGWLHEPEKAPVKPGTREWIKRQEERHIAEAEAGLSKDEDDPANWPAPDMGDWSA